MNSMGCTNTLRGVKKVWLRVPEVLGESGEQVFEVNQMGYFLSSKCFKIRSNKTIAS